MLYEKISQIMKIGIKRKYQLLLAAPLILCLSLAATGCSQKPPTPSPAFDRIKAISTEAKEKYDSLVEGKEERRPSPGEALAGVTYFDEKLLELRNLRSAALSTPNANTGETSSILRACGLTENYLISLKETYRRFAEWDDSSSVPMLDLSRNYFQEISDFTPEAQSPKKPARKETTASGPRANILIIVVDTLRADHMGYMGYGRATTPFLDSLAAKSLVFENAFAQAPHTPPSVATILTGDYPSTHGLITACEWKSDLSLVSAFQSAGYETAAFSANPIINADNGYAEGFDSFIHRPEAVAPVLINEFFMWLSARDGDRPFFVYLHLMDPHDSYDAPPPFNGAFDPGYARRFFASWIYDVTLHDLIYESDPDSTGWIDENETYRLVKEQTGKELTRRDIDKLMALYDEEIAYSDDALKKMFGALERNGALKNMVVAFTSDHGESFMEHGYVEHGNTLYDEAIHVPLFFWDNGNIFKSRRDDSIVESVDIMPTLIAAAKISTALKPDGRSLISSSSPQSPIAFSSTWYARSYRNKTDIRKFSARTKKYKLIYTPDPLLYELYDLESGDEKTNLLAGNESAAPEEISDALKNYVAGFNWIFKDGSLKENPKMLKDMKSLGYVK